jgi:tRNA-2-methylthio-N6-dimethylallyladenosine synthase
VDDELVTALAEVSVLAPYLHLPAQSGSDRVLSRMKRRYTSDEYRAIAARIRRRVPEIALSSDFIVGFPGETEEDFRDTLTLMRDVRFSNVYAFRYSPRPGTASARWGSASEVPEETAARRLAELLALQTGIQREINGELVGRELEILVEGTNRHGQTTGRTPCNRILHLESEKPDPGTYVRARVTRGLPNSLAGRLT